MYVGTNIALGKATSMAVSSALVVDRHLWERPGGFHARLVLSSFFPNFAPGHQHGEINNTHSWADSDIFSAEMYGSAMNSPDNHYQISEGWFSGATSLYDPDNAFVSELINPGRNFYGFIDARYNFQARGA